VVASIVGETSSLTVARTDRAEVDPLARLGPQAQADAAALLAVAADANRLAIVAMLTTGPRCVCEVQQLVPLPSNRLSYHLRVLREAGLITGVKRGRWIDYSLAPDALDRLHAAIPAASPSIIAPGPGPAERCPQ
jgi:ArsR family transcriptional regulator